MKKKKRYKTGVWQQLKIELNCFLKKSLGDLMQYKTKLVSNIEFSWILIYTMSHLPISFAWLNEFDLSLRFCTWAKIYWCNACVVVIKNYRFATWDVQYNF